MWKLVRIRLRAPNTTHSKAGKIAGLTPLREGAGKAVVLIHLRVGPYQRGILGSELCEIPLRLSHLSEGITRLSDAEGDAINESQRIPKDRKRCRSKSI
jgi:hypothetical protein